MNLLTTSFWRDEAFSALIIHHNLLDVIRLSAKDANPPLYYILLWVWQHFFGNSEIALRSLNIIFFVATVLTLWRIAKRLEIKQSWVILLLGVTQPTLVRYAFEARNYTLLALLTSLAILFFLEERYILLVISLTLLVYTHIFGFWVVLILLGWAILKKMQWWWLLIPIILFLPWLPQTINFAKAGGALPYQLTPLLAVGTLLLLGTPVVVSLIPYFKKLLKDSKFQLFFVLWFIPLVGTAIYSEIKQFLFLDRYLIETVPPLLLAIIKISGKKGASLVLTTVILVQALASFVIFTGYQTSIPGLTAINPDVAQLVKPPFRDLTNYIKVHSHPGDVVVDKTPLTFFETSYYGLAPVIYNPHNYNIPTYLGKVLIPDRVVIKKLPLANRYWVISSSEAGGESNDRIPDKLVYTRTFGALKLSLYVKN